MKSKYNVLLFTLGNINHFNDSCQAKLFSENGRKELLQRSQDFYDCISKKFNVVAWGCGRHEYKELSISNSAKIIPKVNNFISYLDENCIDYDIVIQMGCHPNIVHKKPYFIYTDSGFSNATKMEDLDNSFYPPKWYNANVGTDIFHTIFANANAVLTMSPLTSYCLAYVNGVNKDKISCVGAEAKGFVDVNYKKSINSYINILWIGSRFEEKGGAAVLESFNKLQNIFPNIKLIMLGIDSVPDMYSHLTANVQLVPFTENFECLDSIYMKSDIFILPSLREPFGLVYIEAMARKLPVIVSSRSGLASVVTEKGIGKVVKPNDIDTMVNILTSWITNIQDAFEIGEKAYIFARKNFTEDILSYRIREVVDNTLKGKPIVYNYL